MAIIRCLHTNGLPAISAISFFGSHSRQDQLLYDPVHNNISVSALEHFDGTLVRLRWRVKAQGCNNKLISRMNGFPAVSVISSLV